MHLSQQQIEQQLQINPNTRKVLIFDLDGTIVYQGQPLDAKIEHLLLNVKAAGHQIMFATGRSLRDFLPVVPSWCHEQDCVLFGGGLTLAQGQIRRQHFMSTPDVAEIVAQLEQAKVSYLVDGHQSYYHPTHSTHWLYDNIMKISDQPIAPSVDQLIADGAYKIMVLNEQWLPHFEDFIQGRELVIKYHFYDKCFDLMPTQVNKFTGLSPLSLPALNDVFVFGNDHNDLELMQEFPNSVMFGHHHELIKYAKLQVEYDEDLFDNLAQIINTIIKK